MARFSVTLDDKIVLAALKQLRERTSNMHPALKEIGEELVESTKRRFETSTGPDGSSWQKNGPVTTARWMSGKGLHKKNGDLNKRGETRQAAKRPLIGRSRMLSHTITAQLHGSDTLLVGSPMEYASTHQFGAKMGEFGRYYQLSRLKYGEKDFRRYAGMRQGHPIPWGDIPARPFLGVSLSDRETILGIVEKHLGLE
jgi:phage gpG-like protein